MALRSCNGQDSEFRKWSGGDYIAAVVFLYLSYTAIASSSTEVVIRGLTFSVSFMIGNNDVRRVWSTEKLGFGSKVDSISFVPVMVWSLSTDDLCMS
jgi:hypothetical protein